MGAKVASIIMQGTSSFENGFRSAKQATTLLPATKRRHALTREVIALVQNQNPPGAERKTSYHFASRNEKKTRIIREVIALVQHQNPPGHFLKRDPADTGWWIEEDDEQVTRKIRWALNAKQKHESGKQEELERPEKRARFDGNEETEPPNDETAPARLNDLCNAEDQVRQPCNDRAEKEDNITSVRARETATIRTPHPHDVLFGRGIRFYHHAGNVHFRAWVSERSTSYILASNEMKASIAREVIATVQSQNPPGRFLQRDPNHAGWWVETDDGSAVKRNLKKKLNAEEKKSLSDQKSEFDSMTLLPPVSLPLTRQHQQEAWGNYYVTQRIRCVSLARSVEKQKMTLLQSVLCTLMTSSLVVASFVVMRRTSILRHMPLVALLQLLVQQESMPLQFHQSPPPSSNHGNFRLDISCVCCH
jgi:hypothetical protein